MTDRDRLLELLNGAENKVTEALTRALEKEEWLGIYADYPLANGVIVPPCKVGDKLYIIASISQEIIESVVIGMWIVEDSVSILTIHGTIHNGSLGKTVFLTKEEAEAKLKEMEQ